MRRSAALRAGADACRFLPDLDVALVVPGRRQGAVARACQVALPPIVAAGSARRSAVSPASWRQERRHWAPSCPRKLQPTSTVVTRCSSGEPPVTLQPDYFDSMYELSPDPWGFESRWYEARKYAISLAVLPAERYGDAFEPGCSIGVLTRSLAARCDRLLSCDGSLAAVAATAARTAGLPNVRVEQRVMPGAWPEGDFDLIVFSEILYYFAGEDLGRILDLAVTSLRPRGHCSQCIGGIRLLTTRAAATKSTVSCEAARAGPNGRSPGGRLPGRGLHTQ